MQFDEVKVTQAAARILKLRGGRMHYLKLIKLLYLVDREALSRWGIPVTWDCFVSMDNGPVLSRVYDLVTDETAKPTWAEYISPPLGEYEVALLKDAPADHLSRAEEKLIEEVYARYGYWNRWDLVKFMHTLPEWQNPRGGAIPIETRNVLKAVGVGSDEIQAINKEVQAESTAEKLFSAVK